MPSNLRFRKSSNEPSVDIAIQDAERGKPYTIQWVQNKEYLGDSRVDWALPFSWKYKFSIRSFDGRGFGYLEINGSLFKDESFSKELMIRGVFLVLSILIMLSLLLPLAGKIPQELFVSPILNLLNLLKEKKGQPAKQIEENSSVEVYEIMTSVEALLFQIKTDAESKILAELAAQVAHDIRSPLAALNICLKMLSQVPEEQRILMRNAATRINDIANNLLVQYKKIPMNTGNTIKIWLLVPLIESVVSEKRLALEGRNIEINTNITNDCFSAFAEFDANEMKRLFSNLINNSIEAFSIGKSGRIVLSLNIEMNQIKISIKDNGIGIPKEYLSKVLEPGITLKSNGNGLGLSHAKKKMLEWGGSLFLSSEQGKGTEVFLSLPRVKTPAWFVSEIKLSKSVVIGILDDDLSVHDAWDQRLSEVSKNLEIHHFRHSKDFIDWYSIEKPPVQIFSDYELLGDEINGLEVLEKLSLGRNAILVTSHYENPEIIERCQKQGIGLLPKNLLAHISISVC